MIERNDGVVMINGENIDDLKGVELRKTIGYVIQNIGLFPHMNVHKNIATVPRLLKWKEDTIDQRVADMLTLVGLEPSTYKDKKPAQLSGGGPTYWSCTSDGIRPCYSSNGRTIWSGRSDQSVKITKRI